MSDRIAELEQELAVERYLHAKWKRDFMYMQARVLWPDSDHTDAFPSLDQRVREAAAAVARRRRKVAA